MFHRDGRPIGYDYQRSGIASVTIRPKEEGREQLLSRVDTLRVIQSVKDDKTRAAEKKE
jgi:hypothetical protein